MKNLFKSLALVAVSALAVVSCQKSELTDQKDGEGIFFSLRTGDAGKTYIVAGEGEDAGKYLPMWKKGDEIGVLFEGFEEDDDPAGTLANVADDGKEADFQGTISGAPEEGNLYAFYPSAIAKAYDNQAVGFDILETQNPTATSFDPKADLLISKPVYFLADDSGVYIDNVKFARALAMLKINVYSADFEDIQGQYLSKLTVTAVDGRLAGRPVFDLSAGDAKITTYNKPGVSVAAEYEEDIVCVGSSKTATGCSVFLMVAPETLNKDAKLKFTGVTSGYTIFKETTLPKDIVLTPGKCTEINLGLTEENCKPIIKADWKIVTDVNDLSSGDLIKIGCSSKEAAAGALYSTNKYFTKVSATFSEDGTMMDSAEAAILVLGGDATNGWSLWVGGNQVGYSGEELALNDKLWTISITETGATTIAEKETHTITMQYNSSSPRFKPYSTNQAAIQIYKFQGTREQLPAPTNVVAEVDQEKANQINVSWDEVENAAEYEVVFTAGDVDVVEKVETTSIEKGGLEFDTEYSVKVKAIPSDYITYTDSDYSTVNVKTNPKPAGLKYFKKVTALTQIEDNAEYLLVHATDAIFDGSRNASTIDGAANYIAITSDDVSSDGIEYDAYKAYEVFIASMTGGYSILTKGGIYFGRTTDSNGFDTSTTDPIASTITFNEGGSVKIAGTGKSTKAFGFVSNKFRFYASSNAKEIYLYKYAEVVTSVAVSGMPQKLIYKAGDNFETAGLSVKATLDDGTSTDVTDAVEWTVTPSPLTTGTTSVSVVATYKGVSSEEKVITGIIVTEPATLESITVKTAPTKVTYTEGENFDPTGLVITRNYSDATNDEYAYEDHESEFTFNPALTEALATTDNKVTITYKGKTCTQAITVNEIPALETMDAIFAAATTAGSTATAVKIKFTNCVVTGVKDNNVYLTDANGTKGLIIYTSGHGFVVGDKLNGKVDCKVQLYSGASELTELKSTTTGLTVTKDGTVTPQTISIADLTGVNTGAVISFSKLSYNGTYFTDGVNSIKPYNKLMDLPTFDKAKKYNVTGVYIQFNTTKEIAPRTAADIEEIEVPYITATPEKSTAAAAGETISVTVKTNVTSWTVESSDPTNFAISDKASGSFKVVVSKNADTEKGREATITVKATGAQDATFTLTQSKAGGGTSQTVTYKQTSTSAASVSSGTAPSGSSVTFKNTYTTKDQLTKNNSMTYTLKGYAGKKITAISMSMHSNKSAGTGKFSLVAGTTTLAEIASNTGFNQSAWNGAWSLSYVTVTPAMTKTDYVIKTGEDVVLTISASANSLFCESITITYE